MLYSFSKLDTLEAAEKDSGRIIYNYEAFARKFDISFSPHLFYLSELLPTRKEPSIELTFDDLINEDLI